MKELKEGMRVEARTRRGCRTLTVARIHRSRTHGGRGAGWVSVQCTEDGRPVVTHSTCVCEAPRVSQGVDLVTEAELDFCLDCRRLAR